MKKILLLISVFVLFLTVNVEAQKQYKEFADDAINADTTEFYSNYKVSKYSGVMMFTFTHTDGTDSLAVATMQGSNTNTTVDATWTTLTGDATLSATSTDGTTTLIKTPPDFLYYRAFLSCAAGDTVAITNPAFIFKEE